MHVTVLELGVGSEKEKKRIGELGKEIDAMVDEMVEWIRREWYTEVEERKDGFARKEEVVFPF